MVVAMREIISRSVQETRKIARKHAREIMARADSVGARGAVIVALAGELGAGKTAFAQGFARALGVKENVMSPTFVLMKIYPLRKKRFQRLVHIDCYRIASSRDLLHLGFRELLKDKDAIVLIEWAERIKKILPRGAIWLRFRHGVKPHQRIISIS